MEWSQSVDCLEFYNNALFNHKVKPVPSIKRNFLVDHWQRLLLFDFQAPLSNFVGQATLIGRLKEARPQGTMYLNGSANNSFGDLI